MYTEKISLDSFFEEKILFELDKSPAADKVIKAMNEQKSSLYMDNPFFGYILGQYVVSPTIDSRIPTFGCDYDRLYVNTDYMTKLMEDPLYRGKIKGVLLHMLMHVIHRHNERQEGRDKKTWKEASDVVSFLVMADSKASQKSIDPGINWEIPDTSRIPEKYYKKTTNEIYRDMIREKETQPPRNGPGLPGTGPGKSPGRNKNTSGNGLIEVECNLDEIQNEMDIQGISKEQRSMQNDRQEGLIRKAYSQYKSRGDIPSSILDGLTEMIEPKISWRNILQQFIQKSCPVDFTWSRPNRRTLAHDLYLPDQDKESLKVLIAMDTSGSISDDEKMAMLTEANNILQTIGNTTIILVDCDARVHQIKVIEPGEDFANHKFMGGGGTDFRPVFSQKILEEHDPNAILYFTDGYGSFPEKCELPLLWLMTTDQVAPIGETIRYEMTQDND